MQMKVIMNLIKMMKIYIMSKWISYIGIKYIWFFFVTYSKIFFFCSWSLRKFFWKNRKEKIIIKMCLVFDINCDWLNKNKTKKSSWICWWWIWSWTCWWMMWSWRYCWRCWWYSWRGLYFLRCMIRWINVGDDSGGCTYMMMG